MTNDRLLELLKNEVAVNEGVIKHLTDAVDCIKKAIILFETKDNNSPEQDQRERETDYKKFKKIRVRNFLKNNNLSIKDVQDWHDKDFMKFRNLGRKTLIDFKQELNALIS